MMITSLFQKSRPVSSLLEGFVDCHCHILPGVDDGSGSLEDSLDILKEYESSGVRGVCFTPHVMEDVPNTSEHLKEVFEKLKAAYDGPLTLSLASENMMDELFERRLSSKDFLPIGGIRLLVETSYYNPPYNMDDLLANVFSVGYFPILAHPERYVYMDEKDYLSLKSRGVEFQLNISSLFGYYGRTAQTKAKKLLAKGMYNYAGSDLHRKSLWLNLKNEKLKEKEYEALERLFASNNELLSPN